MNETPDRMEKGDAKYRVLLGVRNIMIQAKETGHFTNNEIYTLVNMGKTDFAFLQSAKELENNSE